MYVWYGINKWMEKSTKTPLCTQVRFSQKRTKMDHPTKEI